jgi:hypothetical protein
MISIPMNQMCRCPLGPSFPARQGAQATDVGGPATVIPCMAVKGAFR